MTDRTFKEALDLGDYYGVNVKSLAESMQKYYDRVFLSQDRIGFDYWWQLFMSDIWAD